MFIGSKSDGSWPTSDGYSNVCLLCSSTRDDVQLLPASISKRTFVGSSHKLAEIQTDLAKQ